LLFKSARNSTSNQASLAVAVVEGQAGVAKAFRIGANLVLTKPINIEQAKGTLRVARGLLRKGEPAKPASAAPAVPPAKPVAAKPVPPLKSASPLAPPAISVSIPAAPPEVKPAAPQAWPAAAAASSVPAANDDDLLDIGSGAPVPAASAADQAAKSPSSFSAGLSSTRSSGAASAPAPARDVHGAPATAASPASSPADDNILSDEPAKAAESSSYAGSAPSFTFGGANVPEKSSGGSKKIIFGVVAAALVAGASYIGWTVFHKDASQPVSTPVQTAPAPAPVPQVAKPSGGKPAPTIPATSAAPSVPVSAAPESHPSSQPSAAPAKSQAATTTTDTASDDEAASPAVSKPAAAPLVLKGGSAPASHAKPAAPETEAPSMIGIATPGAGAPPPNIVGAERNAPAPVLQTLNVSQGVSQGLLTKKVQPIYPRNALAMHVEGAVELVATISKTGDISHVKTVSGDGQLAKAATDAVKQWKYKPYLLNGEPVEIQTQITINFKLPK
jgi:protein TonB